MKIMKVPQAALAVVLLGGAAFSQAASVTVVAEVPASWGAVTTSESLDIPGEWTTAPSERFGSSGQARSPFEPFDGNTLDGWESIGYWSVGPSSETTEAVMTFSGERTGLSLLWGSVDSYNSIEFYKNGDVVDTVLGSSVETLAPNGLDAALVSISAVTFDEVHFISDTNAFEFSNVAAVPVPAAVWLFGSALLGLAGIKRKRS
ncbi:MAG: VPLPA-CTERM sorting domain-containing protein [Halioglobus sp.]